MGIRLQYLQQNLRQLEPWVLFVLLVIGTPYVCLAFFPDKGLAFGLAGGLIQFFGLLTVVWQIIEIRKAFELPRISSLILEWFKRWKVILGKKGKASEGSMDFVDALQTRVTVVGADLWAPPLPTDTSEQKIEKLTKWVDSIHKTVRNNASIAHSELQVAKNEFRQMLEGTEAKQVAQQDRTIGAITGNHTMEILGVLLILIGVFYSVIGLVMD